MELMMIPRDVEMVMGEFNVTVNCILNSYCLPPWAKHTFSFGYLSRTPPNIMQQIAWAVSPGIPAK